MQVKLTVRTADRERDVEITSRTEVAAQQLVPVLANLMDAAADSPASGDGQPLPPGAMLGDPGLRSGCVLTLGAGGRRSSVAGSALQLRVIAGPDCGQMLALTRGRQLIGRAEAADLSLRDPDVSRLHAELSVDLHTVSVRDLDSTNGTWLNDVKLGSERVDVRLGAVLRIGSSVLSVTAIREPPAAVTPDDQGNLLVHRPPRVPEPADSRAVEFPVKATTAPRPRLRWLSALLPAGLGIGCAMVMHSSQFLAFAVLSPITLLAGAAADRRDWRRQASNADGGHARTEKAAREELAGRLAAEASRRRHTYPDAAEVLCACSTPDCRLWERRPYEEDFLTVRLGIADQAAETKATRAGRDLPPTTVPAVPVTVSLTGGALGLAGPLPLVRGSARWLIGQLLALHSPRDLCVVALLDGESEDWRWMRWAPTVKDVTTKPEEHQQLLNELIRIITDRQSRQAGAPWLGGWVVVVVDRARAIAALDGLRQVLDQGPAVGVTAICVDEDLRLLPPSCRSTATVRSETGAGMEVCRPNRSALREVVPDRVSRRWADQLARSLAPLRDAEPDGTTELPTDVWLADLLESGDATDESLLRRWSTLKRPATLIGVAGSGPLEIDLVRDGPHLLIAGSTGSGKSELLRSLVTGLATNHAPDEIAFVLIDYKGGAAFADCADFPHTVGLVTDLDGHLTTRALSSLEAEIRRRETAFAEAGVADLDAYRRSAVSERRRLPRLVLVVDEFAYLAEELPNFLSGLIGIAQRGRSLGLHLVLATQRPAGVVSPEIKANIPLRIALRVTDATESQDVIGSDVASRISKNQPGRGYARLADGLIEFQAARTGGSTTSPQPLFVTVLDAWNRLPGSTTALAGLPDELQLLRTAMSAAAAKLKRALPERPWLPPLPNCIPAAELDPDPADRFRVSFGMADDPSRQWQFPVSHNLISGGSIGFIGGPRSGRSSALQTFLGRAAEQLGADEMHFYVLDCAGRGFGHFTELAQCGAVVGREDPRSIARLMSRLVEEIGTRQRALAELGVTTVAEAHSMSICLPVIVLAIDGWEGFVGVSDDYDAGRTVEALLQLLRDGASVGITVLIAGDRAMLGLRVAPALTRKLLLALTDRSDYAIAGLPPASLPVRFVPGRAVEVGDGLEIQLAVLTSDRGAQAQRAVIRRIRGARPVGNAEPSIRIRSLPESVSQATLLNSAANALDAADRSSSCLLGIGGDDALPIWTDLFLDHLRFLICGPARSGRSTAAATICRQGLSAGLTIVIAAPGRSPLAGSAAQNGIALLRPEIRPDDRTTSALISADLVVIDDAEQFNDSVNGPLLTELTIRSRAAVIATARSEDLMVSFRGPAVEVRRHRTGLLLQPGPADGELLGVRTGPHRLAAVPGRGLLVTDSTRRTAPDGLVLQVAV